MPARHLYVHVPFCSRRCAYCDFSIAVRRTVPVADYLRGIEAELAQVDTENAGPLDTLYLGGGTPSKLGSDGICELLRLVRKRFQLSGDAEISLEANPEDVSNDSVAAWRAAGVNRLSIGIQSFDDAVLKWMHRVHDSDAGMRSIATARRAGMDNISIDLIFALPPEIDRTWRLDLEQAIAVKPDHISLYGLTVEPSTPLARWQARSIVSPSREEDYAEQFLMAHSMVTSAGFAHYEVSNFAVEGKQSRHNSAYWSGASYLGIGPAAHSYDGARRSWNVRAYPDWLRRVSAGCGANDGSEQLTPANRAAENVYLGLRTARGYAASRRDLRVVREWKEAGWAHLDDKVIRLTPEGWLRLDSLASGLTGF